MVCKRKRHFRGLKKSIVMVIFLLVFALEVVSEIIKA